jgi:hypothetical protein
MHLEAADFPGLALATPEYGDYYYKSDVVGSDIWPCAQICAAPEGHLCNFTTEEPGELILQLLMYTGDLDSRVAVEMQADAVFDVADGSQDDLAARRLAPGLGPDTLRQPGNQSPAQLGADARSLTLL